MIRAGVGVRIGLGLLLLAGAFDPPTDGPHLLNENWVTARLLELLDQSYDQLLLARRAAATLRLVSGAES